MDAVIDFFRCRYCLASIVFNPFVGQWQTIPETVCSVSPEVWKTHQVLIAYSPARIREVIGDLVAAIA